jgi:hypothetical protein
VRHWRITPARLKTDHYRRLGLLRAALYSDAALRPRHESSFESHKALAEYYYFSGNPNAAIQQLQIATRYAGDNFYLQSSLEARIAAIKEEMAIYQGK